MVKAKELPDVKLLREYFSYNPTSGDLTLLKTTSQRTVKGYICNSTSDNGYKKVSFRNKSYQVTRIIWKIHTGEEPDTNIDHINGDRGDNRFSNLRSVDHFGNGGNRAGVLGYSKKRNKFVPRITHRGRTKEVKYCACETSARVSFLQERVRLGLPIERLLNERHLL